MSSLLLIALVACGCRSKASFDQPLPPDGAFPREDPSPAEAARFAAAARYSAGAEGLSLLVLRKNRLLFEDYSNGNRPETPHHIFSGTKSFAGVMVLAALADGLLTLDELVADTLPEMRGDAFKEQITVRHLLDFTSGWERAYRLTWDAIHVPQRVEDKYATTLELEVEWPPGSRYRYGNSHLMVLGRFLQKKLGRDPLEFLKERITDRLGIRFAGWLRDPAGNPMLPFGAWLTAYEWAKFGVFLLQQGVWEGEALLPPEFLAGCFQGSEAMPAYGLTFWLNQNVPKSLRPGLIPQLRGPAKRGRVLLPGGPPDLFVAAGHNGNRCYVIPSHDLVIVRLGTRERGFSDERLLRLVLGMKDH
ncbi:MAG: beta-lactamase family protein [Planctomycetes bacterium]|nr:beta-lactamase family protein [Planctomycetota bacterium]